MPLAVMTSLHHCSQRPAGPIAGDGENICGVTYNDIAKRHLKACGRFDEAVTSADGRWDWPSPCDGWNARGVLEHVIGFHDVLLLRPLDAKPERPRDGPESRWQMTYEALGNVLARNKLFDRVMDVPAVGNNPPTQIDLKKLVHGLTQEVLVHTWDLARAVGADDHLDPDLCRLFHERLPTDAQALVASGMFRSPLPMADDTDTDTQSRLLAHLGRDPRWQSSTTWRKRRDADLRPNETS